jgi:hypothetical protein
MPGCASVDSLAEARNVIYSWRKDYNTPRRTGPWRFERGGWIEHPIRSIFTRSFTINHTNAQPQTDSALFQACGAIDTPYTAIRVAASCVPSTAIQRTRAVRMDQNGPRVRVSKILIHDVAALLQDIHDVELCSGNTWAKPSHSRRPPPT